MVLYIQPVKRLCKREILYGEQQIFMRGKDICCFLCNRKICYDVVGTGSWPFGQLFYHVGKVSEFPIWQKQLSHCGGGEHVAVTTRRRRRILQAGFFFTL
jgi:hypothetical protein